MPTSAQALRPVSNRRLLLDRISGAVFGYALRQLRSTYHGYAVLMERDDAQQLNIGFRHGDFDLATYLAWNLGHTSGVRGWYDQMGSSTGASNANRFVNTTFANQGTINPSWRNGRPAVQFRKASSQSLTMTNTFGVALAQPVTTLLVGSFDGTYNSDAIGVFHSGPTASHRMQLYTGSSGVWSFYAGTVAPALKGSNTTPNIFTALFNGGGSNLAINGRVLIQGGDVNTNDWTQIQLGSALGASFSDVTIAELIGFNANNNATNVAIEESQSAYYQIACIARGRGTTTPAGTGVTTGFQEPSKWVRPDGVVVLTYLEAVTGANFSGNRQHIRYSSDYGASYSPEDKLLDGVTSPTYLLNGVQTNFPMTLPSGAISGNMGITSPWLIPTPAGGVVCEQWATDYAGNDKGTWQNSSPDGQTWGEWAQVTFVGLPAEATQPGGLVQNETFMTDDSFILMSSAGVGTIYSVARVMETSSADNNKTTPAPGRQRSILVTSTDNAVTWTFVSNITTYTSGPGWGTLECALEYVVIAGVPTIVAVLRAMPGVVTFTGWTTKSTNLGASFGAGGTQLVPGPLIDITSMTLNTGRPIMKTRAHLRAGKDLLLDLTNSWANDPVLIMSGFVGFGPIILLSAATTASPAVFSTVAAVAHNLVVNDLVTTYGISQNGSAINPNGYWRVNTTPSASTFTLKSVAGTVLNGDGVNAWTGGSIIDSTTNPNNNRRVCVWVSYGFDGSGYPIWSHPIYLDSDYGQCYGDMFYDPMNGWYVVVTSKQSAATVVLNTVNQYKFSLAGL